MTIDVGALIDRAVAIGTTNSAAAVNAAEAAAVAAQGFSSVNALDNYAAFNIVEPNVYIPSNAAGIDQGLYNSTTNGIVNMLATSFGNFFTNYFPLDASVMSYVNTWLNNAINAGGTGVNIAVENAIWQRDRDRIATQALSAANEATASWAAKGFPLPPGAAVAAVTQINRDRDIKIGESSRDRAIETWKMEYDNVRFAIQQTIDFRVKAIMAAGDYIKTVALGPQLGVTLATAALNAQANLINAATGFYNARIRVQEAHNDIQKTQFQHTLQAGMKSADLFMEGVRTQASTAVAVANTLGQQAASALNAVSGVAQVITNQ